MDSIPSIEFRIFETIIPIESNLLGKSCLEFSYSFELDALPCLGRLTGRVGLRERFSTCQT